METVHLDALDPEPIRRNAERVIRPDLGGGQITGQVQGPEPQSKMFHLLAFPGTLNWATQVAEARQGLPVGDGCDPLASRVESGRRKALPVESRVPQTGGAALT